MLNLFADCLILASRLPNSDSLTSGDRLRRREDEEWLMQRGDEWWMAPAPGRP